MPPATSNPSSSDSSSPPSTSPRGREGSGYFSGPTSPRLDTISEHIVTTPRIITPLSRSGSLSGPGIAFEQPKEKTKVSWGQGKARPVKNRGSSPPPASKFESHVSFDNVAAGEEPTERNPISFTLKEQHTGYHYKRASRTFMCGINEDAYSDYALQWMLDEMVDDGDEIICLRVVDQGSKLSNDKGVKEKYYQKEARMLMEMIQKKNGGNRAIKITVELAIGKVHPTFQRMIQLHEPAMLIVGTRGRSLGGVQGLIGNRNSFSKWCLQYSPIPVVVVRPTDKRDKKKHKRFNDPNRHSYAQMLQDSGVSTHEADLKVPNENWGSSGGIGEVVEILPPNSTDLEAHEVAAALGLPAKFDPTIKQEDLDSRLQKIKSQHRSEGDTSSLQSSPANSRSTSPAALLRPKVVTSTDSPAISEDESGSVDEGEFEVTPGHALKAEEVDHEVMQKKLHAMEQGEAAALSKGRKGSVGSIVSVESNGNGDGTRSLSKEDSGKAV